MFKSEIFKHVVTSRDHMVTYFHCIEWKQLGQEKEIGEQPQKLWII